jgi:hypothetical protein
MWIRTIFLLSCPLKKKPHRLMVKGENISAIGLFWYFKIDRIA